MPLLLPEPEQQFCDADGHPYAGGTVTFYVPGTDTPKDTWQDNLGTALNTNPVVLDAAGRAIIFGDGDYRCVLKDADGNLIYDQWTSSVVSDAMQPVVRAATIAEAQALLGITDFSAAIAAETARAEAAESTLTTNLAAEVTRAEAAEAHLQSEIDALAPGASDLGSTKAGTATTDSSGAITVTFSAAFPTALIFLFTQGSVGSPTMYPPAQALASGLWVPRVVSGDHTSNTGFKVHIYLVVDPADSTSWTPLAGGIFINWWAVGY